MGKSITFISNRGKSFFYLVHKHFYLFSFRNFFTPSRQEQYIFLFKIWTNIKNFSEDSLVFPKSNTFFSFFKGYKIQSSRFLPEKKSRKILKFIDKLVIIVDLALTTYLFCIAKELFKSNNKNLRIL